METSRGVVFLSSVFLGLEGIRSRVRDLLRSLGFSVWWEKAFAWPAAPAPEWTAAVCLAGVEESDYYLGIYPSRYGSDPLGVGFTELEYHHAVRNGLPVYAYQLNDRTAVLEEQRIKQRGFLNLLHDSQVSGIRAERFDSRYRLLERVRSDFDSLPARAGLTVRGFGLSPALRGLLAAAGRQQCVTAREAPWEERLEMLRASKRASLEAAAMVGLCGLQSIAANFRPGDRSFLTGVDNYLEEWIGVSAWAGLSGMFGQTAAAKARITLAQMLGHYGHISELAGSVASGLYGDRKLAAARKWYGVYRRKGEMPEIIGAIELARGDVGSAMRCFQEVLARPGLNAGDAALHQGYLGLCLARLGRLREAMRASDVAFAHGTVPATALTRIWRARAETLRAVGDVTGAKLAIGKAISVAGDARLAGQLRKAMKAQKAIEVARR